MSKSDADIIAQQINAGIRRFNNHTAINVSIVGELTEYEKFSAQF